MPSGCGFYRIVLPFDELKKHGWHCGYGILLPDDDFGDVDIIVGQRLHLPQLLPFWESARQTTAKLVYEIDDDPFSLDEVNWLARGTFNDPAVREAVTSFAGLADLVTVSTAPLGEVFAGLNPHVAVLPNCLPSDILTITRPRHPKLTIGWAGGASHSADLASVAQVWRDVVDQTGARGHFVGSDFRTMTRPHGFDFTGWERDPRDFYRRIDFDIGLAPLVDTPFARSKSAIKVMEYAGLGVPVVASDHPVYREYVLDGVTGFLCRTKRDWADRLRLLAADPQLREHMGAKARELAARWTVQANWAAWASAYQLLHGRTRW